MRSAGKQGLAGPQLNFFAMQVSIKPVAQLESEDAEYRNGRMFGRKGSSRLAQWVRQDVEQPPLLPGEIQDHLLEWQPGSDLRNERRALQQQWAPVEDLAWDPPMQQGAVAGAQQPRQGRPQHQRDLPASGDQAQAAQDGWDGRAWSAVPDPRERQGAGPHAIGPPNPLPLFEMDPFDLRSAQHQYRACMLASSSLGRPAWAQEQPQMGADDSFGKAGAGPHKGRQQSSGARAWRQGRRGWALAAALDKQ